MKLIETEWQNYRRKVIPVHAAQVQLIESRRAFFAGAWAYYSLVMEHMTPDKEPTDADMKFMAQLDAEMRAFGERVKRGEA
jgi:hypothetical protein